MRKALAFIAMLVCVGTAVSAQERAQAYVGARIIPISGPAIDDGVLIVKGGKIVMVGPRSTVRVSADVETHDVSGKVIMPGIVDTHSHIGGGAGGDRSGPI